jgi:hypothetical protein
MKRVSSNQDIYLKTFAILDRMRIELNEKTCRKAFRFFWDGKRFRADSFESVLKLWEGNERTGKDPEVTDDEIRRMKIALSDSFGLFPRLLNFQDWTWQ